MVQPKEHIKLAIITCCLHFLYSLIIRLFSYHLINVPKAMDTAKHSLFFCSFTSFCLLPTLLSIYLLLFSFLYATLPLSASFMILRVVLPRLPGSYHILVVLTTKFISSIWPSLLSFIYSFIYSQKVLTACYIFYWVLKHYWGVWQPLKWPPRSLPPVNHIPHLIPSL